ncbi:hypothetical protein TRFO_04034 [Tritrichomonas foetus]|uniref:Uncharacterized protein n=1 Tax=Tritrichomonas foetus TaxID=1144522 RepID=A0A1J4KMR4_9EUKA|nr:hypothetical protein TRFO_04034 [Tritrichomonas foetus]|eukprot:OHT11092.1 hypothetical protein TRFO_04034 [Tritrichomonas foetus]
MTQEIVPICELLEPDQLKQAELIQDLQSWLFDLSTENYNFTRQNIIDSVFIKSKDGVEQLARNIFFAGRFRAMNIELLSDLVSELNSRSSEKNSLKYLKDFLMESFFSKAFHDEYSYKETWRYFFLYQCMKRKVYSDIEIIYQIKLFYQNHLVKEKEIGLYKIICAWFAPEIEKNAPELFATFEEAESIDAVDENDSNENKTNDNNYEELNETTNLKEKNENDNNETEINETEKINQNSEQIEENNLNNHINNNDNYNEAVQLEDNNQIPNIFIHSTHKDSLENENNNDEQNNNSTNCYNNHYFHHKCHTDSSYGLEEDNDLPPIIFQGNEENETRVFDVLKNQGFDLETFKADNWAFYNQCRDFGYTIDPLVYALITDNDDELQSLTSSPNFETETIIDPSLFSRSAILQDNTTPICFAAAMGAVKCFKFLLVNNAVLECETMNEYSTTIASFAVAGGSNEIVRLLYQKNCDFQEALFVAVQYHRTDIFKWLYQNVLSVDIETSSLRYGTLLHRAAKSNNVTLSIFCMEHRCDVNRPVANRFN